MPGRVQCFYDIPIAPKMESVLVRLGGRKNAPLEADFFKMLEEGMKRARVVSHPTGVYLRLKILNRTPDFIGLENGIYFLSKSLSRLLQYSEEAVLMAATVGREIVALIMEEVVHKDAALGVILDAVASQTADAVLDWMMDYLNSMLAKKGRMLTKHRYSPGYGDLPLAYQQPVFEALRLRDLGLELTGKYMLAPEKSVIAIAGIEARGS
ncbi:MAG: methionine synthase [Firmicutes bacterium]|nr:methionine synthase [Bacillota bacterium]